MGAVEWTVIGTGVALAGIVRVTTGRLSPRIGRVEQGQGTLCEHMAQHRGRLMAPLDPKNLQRLVSTLEETERAIEVAQLHVAAGCPEAAANELSTAKASVGHAIRIANGPARDYVPELDDDNERLHAHIAAGRGYDWMTEEERELYDY